MSQCWVDTWGTVQELDTASPGFKCHEYAKPFSFKTGIAAAQNVFLIAPQCDMEHFGKFWNKILNCFRFAWGLIICGAQNQHSWWSWDSQWPAAGSLIGRGFGQPGLGLAGVICGVSWNVAWEHKEGSNYKTGKADSGLTKKESGKNKRAVPQSTGEFECSQINLALLVRADQLTDPKLLTCSYPGHPAPSPAILHTTWMVWFACAV